MSATTGTTQRERIKAALEPVIAPALASGQLDEAALRRAVDTVSPPWVEGQFCSFNTVEVRYDPALDHDYRWVVERDWVTGEDLWTITFPPAPACEPVIARKKSPRTRQCPLREHRRAGANREEEEGMVVIWCAAPSRPSPSP